MKSVRVEFYSLKDTEQLQKTVTIPLNKLDTGLQFLPKEAKAILDKGGVDLSQSRKLTKEKGLVGTLIEIETSDQRIVISAE